MENDKNFICENIQLSSPKVRENICRILKNNIPEIKLKDICYECDDGTRINLDEVDDNIIKEIYTIIKNELGRI
jgi:hypothetical protein